MSICSATTKTGQSCSKRAKEDSDYCGVHQRTQNKPPKPTKITLNNLPPSSGQGKITIGPSPPEDSVVVYFTGKNNSQYRKTGILCRNLAFENLPFSEKETVFSHLQKCATLAGTNVSTIQGLSKVLYFEIPTPDNSFSLFNKVIARKYILQIYEQSINKTSEFTLLKNYYQNGGHLHFPYSLELSSEDPAMLIKAIDLYYDPEHFPFGEYILLLLLVLPKEKYFWLETTSRY